MGLLDSLFGKKKTTEDTNQTAATADTATSTPNAPPWMTDAWAKLFQQGGLIGSEDPSQFVAGPSALQKVAFGQAPGVGQQSQALIGDAAARAGAVPTTANTYAPATIGTGAQVRDPTMVSASGARSLQGPLDPTQTLQGMLTGKPDTSYLNNALKGTVDQSLIGYNDAVDAAGKSLTRSVLPAIRSGAIAAGGYGGSRQGIAEGTAIGDSQVQLDRNARDLTTNAQAVGANLLNSAYENAQGRAASIGTGLNDQAVATATGNADRQQQTALTQAGLDQSTIASDTAAKNAAGQFNAGQGDTAASRGLTAAGLIGSLGGSAGADQRANTALIGDLGGTQQTLDQAQAQAPMTIAQFLAQLYGAAPADALVGKTVNTNGTKSLTGNTTTIATKTPGLMDYFGNNLDLAAKVLSGGMG